MIDIDDLMHLRICRKCNVIFMPEDTESYIRQEYCKRCKEQQSTESDAK